ncbi:MAG: methyltransferase domain-containing protein [Candidatus Krumholzibacteria bacterium]|nr:methyltransferase domain-containing protein [Candidatus Krumholzibacteria bacterium]
MAQRVCPWWFGYFLASPIRRLIHDPRKILAPHIRPGMAVLDMGPGMATFTLDLARFVGPSGKIIAVDVQPRMLEEVRKRAARARLLERIELRIAGDDNAWASDLAGRIDFALAFYLVHEVPDVAGFFALLRSTLTPGGRMLVVEPIMHVSARGFADTITAALKAGFTVVDRPRIPRSRSALLSKD